MDDLLTVCVMMGLLLVVAAGLGMMYRVFAVFAGL